MSIMVPADLWYCDVATTSLLEPIQEPIQGTYSIKSRCLMLQKILF